MSVPLGNARRATRLLRWYPPSWRQRYGEEFVDHLEQEFADQSVNRKRTVNIAWKGLVARVADVGLLHDAPSRDGSTRSAVATSFALTALISVLAVNFASLAMISWSARKYHPVPVSATTGILMGVAALLMVVLVVIVLLAVVAVVRQFIQGRGRPLVGPSLLAGASGSVLLFAIRGLPRMLARYSHLFQGGDRWVHPGSAAYGLAAIANSFTQPWVAIWNPELSGGPRIDTVVNDFVPLAVLVFGVAIAQLLRRVEAPIVSARMASLTVTLLGALIGAFLLAYVAWLEVGGPTGNQAFWTTGAWAGSAYLVFLAIVAVLLARAGLREWRLIRMTQSTGGGDAPRGTMADPQSA